MKYSIINFVMDYSIDNLFEDITNYKTIETLSKTIIDIDTFTPLKI